MSSDPDQQIAEYRAKILAIHQDPAYKNLVTKVRGDFEQRRLETYRRDVRSLELRIESLQKQITPAPKKQNTVYTNKSSAVFNKGPKPPKNQPTSQPRVIVDQSRRPDRVEH